MCIRDSSSCGRFKLLCSHCLTTGWKQAWSTNEFVFLQDFNIASDFGVSDFPSLVYFEHQIPNVFEGWYVQEGILYICMCRCVGVLIPPATESLQPQNGVRLVVFKLHYIISKVSSTRFRTYIKKERCLLCFDQKCENCSQSIQEWIDCIPHKNVVLLVCVLLTVFEGPMYARPHNLNHMILK